MSPPYPIWIPGVTPHTNSRATVMARRFVLNATVIRVTGARYRNCLPINDTFELVNPGQLPSFYHGALRIEVLCSWFGVVPPTTHPNIIVLPNQFQILKVTKSDVVDDIRA